MYFSNQSIWIDSAILLLENQCVFCFFSPYPLSNVIWLTKVEKQNKNRKPFSLVHSDHNNETKKDETQFFSQNLLSVRVKSRLAWKDRKTFIERVYYSRENKRERERRSRLLAGNGQRENESEKVRKSERNGVKTSGIRWKCETRAVYFSKVKVFKAITQNGPSSNQFQNN